MRRGSHQRGYTRSLPRRTWTSYVDAALGGLRAAGWPAPEDPGGDDDAELDGRDLICDRLLDEAGWLRQCAGWLTHLHTKGFPSAVNLRPEGDRPERAHMVAGLPRVAAILNRIAADIVKNNPRVP